MRAVSLAVRGDRTYRRSVIVITVTIYVTTTGRVEFLLLQLDIKYGRVELNVSVNERLWVRLGWCPRRGSDLPITPLSSALISPFLRPS
jgi:hypothetical protein